MEGELNRRHLLTKALAGLAAGALGWVPNELVMHGHRLGQPLSPALVIGDYIAQAILAGLIGGFVLSAEPPAIEFTARTKRRLVQAFVICALLSFFSSYYSDRVFNSVLQAGGVRFNAQGEMISGSIVMLVVARVLGWGIEGALVGLGVGVASFVGANLVKGLIGGLIGGVIGGLSFDVIAVVTGGGLAARFFGFSAVGLAIGLFIGLVHELTKVAWLKVEAGRLRNRQFVIEKSTVAIGRAEENDVGLFGDPEVKPRHAVISRSGQSFILKDVSGGAGLWVNGRAVSNATLSDGDRIRIGNYELSFHLKKAAQRVSAAESISQVATQPTSAPAPSGPTPRLVDENGKVYDLRRDGPTHLGRDLGNDVVLMMSSVSRRHAVLEPRNGVFYIKDLGSHNGTYVGGQRVSEAPLKDGDVIELGDARLVFRT